LADRWSYLSDRVYEATPDIAVKGDLGVVYLEELCKKGTAEKIAAYYRYDLTKTGVPSGNATTDH
jgi:hypothetical protein